MTSLLHENRLRLQQRISQRLRGDVKPIASQRDVIPQRFIPRRRRRQDDQSQTDPFRLQAQEYLYQDRFLGDRLLQQQANYGSGDTVQLPVFKPRYTDMYPYKGVPAQKYVDIILDRKGPMHRVPSRYIGRAVDLSQDKQYDNSMTIRSYRQVDDYPSSILRATPDDTQAYGRIMVIGPQRIQYPVHQGYNRLYNLDKGTAPLKTKAKRGDVAAIKGKKMKTMTTTEEQNTVFEQGAKQNLPFLRKVRKRMNSVDHRFANDISSFIPNREPMPGPLILRGRVAQNVPLPPIRITVTNPMPVNSPATPEAADDSNRSTVQNTSTVTSGDTPKKLPFVKLAQSTKEKRKQKRKMKNALKIDSATQHQPQPEQPKDESPTDNDQQPAEEGVLERKDSDNSNLMPAPITKITFQSYNADNLKKPKKVANNVQVERIIQGDVMATHPRMYRRENAPSVKVSNFEMEDNPRPDIVFRRDGSLGPAPPSTNYVNFQRTTRLGGQSRVLLALRNRHLVSETGEILRNWNPSDDSLAIHTHADGLGESPPVHGHNDATVHRKLGRIRAMKRSLLAAHHAVMADEAEGRIEIDTVTDEGRSERSFESNQQKPPVVTRTKAFYVNRLSDPYVPTQPAHTPITGFYMGRSNESYESQVNAQTRTFATQWTADGVNQDGGLNPTPLAPPNTALFEKERRRYQD